MGIYWPKHLCFFDYSYFVAVVKGKKIEGKDDKHSSFNVDDKHSSLRLVTKVSWSSSNLVLKLERRVSNEHVLVLKVGFSSQIKVF